MRLLGQIVFKYAFNYYEHLKLISAFDWKLAHNFKEYCESYYSLYFSNFYCHIWSKNVNFPVQSWYPQKH